MSEKETIKNNCYWAYKNGTFIIRIFYRCNTSWQGEIKWLEGKKQKKFRSLLEMIMLIQEALSEGSTQM